MRATRTQKESAGCLEARWPLAGVKQDKLSQISISVSLSHGAGGGGEGEKERGSAHTCTRPRWPRSSSGGYSLSFSACCFNLLGLAGPRGPAQSTLETGTHMGAEDGKTRWSELQSLLFNFLKIAQCHKTILYLAQRGDLAPVHQDSSLTPEHCFPWCHSWKETPDTPNSLTFQTKCKN